MLHAETLKSPQFDRKFSFLLNFNNNRTELSRTQSWSILLLLLTATFKRCKKMFNSFAKECNICSTLVPCRANPVFQLLFTLKRFSMGQLYVFSFTLFKKYYQWISIASISNKVSILTIRSSDQSLRNVIECYLK